MKKALAVAALLSVTVPAGIYSYANLAQEKDVPQDESVISPPTGIDLYASEAPHEEMEPSLETDPAWSAGMIEHIFKGQSDLFDQTVITPGFGAFSNHESN